MIPPLPVLLVDDHPLITTAYKKAFEWVEQQQASIEFDLNEAHSLSEAIHALERFQLHQPLGILFMDLKLPPLPQQHLYSGEDFALKVREKFPTTQIVIATTYNHNFRIHSIFKSINPEGFLVKNDVNEGEIKQAILDILEGIPYYSKTVRQALRKYVSSDLLLDQMDRHLLYQLSIGTKTKDLTHFLPLSHPGVQRRKKNLKEIFEVEDQDDRALLQAAKELGFI